MFVPSVLQYRQQAGAQGVSDGLGGAGRVLVVRLRVRLFEIASAGTHIGVPLGEEAVTTLLADIVKDAARHHHLGQHGQIHLAPLQQVPPAPPQAGEGGVNHGLGGGEGAGELALFGGGLVLFTVAFHQPRPYREGRVADEMDGDLHPLKHDGFLKERRPILPS